mmetsp:Transcript_53934/g.128196  ORF Transcript_53934/g.128196 Transcript_53934/m.128196 type:complete len:235 (-) Transcript_53934:31-735(-)
MPVHDARRTFPPLQGQFTLKKTSQVLPQSSWVQAGEKPIRLNEEGRKDLVKAIGEKGMALLEKSIGTASRPKAPPPDVDPIFRFETAWGKNVSKPVYKQATSVKTTPEGCTFLDNPCTRDHKFFWPNMTNEYIDGKSRKHPMQVSLPGAVRDLRSWLTLYGEPDPGRIPTGTMTTFIPSTRLLGKERSNASQTATKVDGHTWHTAYTESMRKHYGSRFKEPLVSKAAKAPGPKH